MISGTQESVVNRMIDSLPRSERKQFLSVCEDVDLSFGVVLCDAEQPYQHVYFPLDGFISLMAVVKGHPPLEMGLIGSEGMLGVTLILGVSVSPLRAVVQGKGNALRMTVAQFAAILLQCPTLLRLLNRYLFVLVAQLAQFTVCTRFHEIDQRLARWLLMTHDRAHADHFHLTHQYLAEMLGVQRSAITIAAGALQKHGLIHYSRGEIEILSRGGLEAASCECYAASITDYSQRFGTAKDARKTASIAAQ